MSEVLKIKVGRTYRGKRPGNAGGLVNDRTVVWVGAIENTVQYDGPAVRDGARYPKVGHAEFLKWADRDVTDDLPDGKYAEWPIERAAAQKGGA